MELLSGLARESILRLGVTSPDVLAEFERQCAEFARRSSGVSEIPRGQRATSILAIVSTLVRVWRHAAYLRLTSISVDLTSSMNASRPYGIALSARALLETAASAAYHYRSIMDAGFAWTDDPRQANELGRAVFAAMGGSRFDWSEDRIDGARRRAALVAQYADSIKGPSSINEAVNVLTMLEALRRAVAELAPGSAGLIGHTYAKLSDVCHPAFGGYSFFGMARDTAIDVSSKGAEGQAILLAAEVIPTLVVANTVAGHRLEKMGELASEFGKLDDLMRGPGYDSTS